MKGHVSSVGFLSGSFTLQELFERLCCLLLSSFGPQNTLNSVAREIWPGDLITNANLPFRLMEEKEVTNHRLFN